MEQRARSNGSLCLGHNYSVSSVRQEIVLFLLETLWNGERHPLITWNENGEVIEK